MTNLLLDALFKAMQAGSPPLQAINPLQAYGQQPIDLGRIPVTPQAQAAPAPMPPIPASVPMPQAQQAKPQPQLNENGRTTFGELLYRLGIPAGAALLGTVAPGTLPAMSGLATGYSGQVSKIDEEKHKEKMASMGVPTYTFNADTGQFEETGTRVPKNAKIERLSTAEQKQFQALLSKMGETIPQTKTGEAVKEAQAKTAEINGAPSANGHPDGTKLKNEKGEVVGVAQGGKWVSP